MKGTAEYPRLSVFRSHRHLMAQLIDDARGRTVASASDLGRLKGQKSRKSLTGPERAGAVGHRLAERARTLGITRAQFDRGRYRYHGLVAALAKGARAGGLEF